MVLVDLDGGRLDYSHCAVSATPTPAATPPLPMGGADVQGSSSSQGSVSAPDGAAEAGPPLLPPSVEGRLLDALRRFLAADEQPSDQLRPLLRGGQRATAAASAVADLRATATGNPPGAAAASVGRADGSGADDSGAGGGGADDRSVAALRLTFARALCGLLQVRPTGYNTYNV